MYEHERDIVRKAEAEHAGALVSHSTSLFCARYAMYGCRDRGADFDVDRWRWFDSTPLAAAAWATFAHHPVLALETLTMLIPPYTAPDVEESGISKPATE